MYQIKSVGSDPSAPWSPVCRCLDLLSLSALGQAARGRFYIFLFSSQILLSSFTGILTSILVHLRGGRGERTAHNVKGGQAAAPAPRSGPGVAHVRGVGAARWPRVIATVTTRTTD